MQKLIFLLICTLLLIKPTANAIFLSNLGVENLPYVYVGVALAAFLVTIFYGRFTSVLETKTLFIRSNLICIAILIVMGSLMWFAWAKDISAVLLYLFMSIFGILSASQFWILANQLFNAREARKYFGIIGMGAIAGGIVGGYLASIVSSFMQSEMLLFLAAMLLGFAIFIIRGIEVDYIAPAEQPVQQSAFQDILYPFELLNNSRHLKYLALILALSVFAAKTIDYQFGYFATKVFVNEEDLTTFYGFWYSTFNLVSLLIQVFLTTRIVGRFGVGYSLLILPVLLLINVSLLLFVPVLVFAITTKLSDASLKQSINKASVELMMLPIPEDIKSRTKTFLDVFIDSLATGVSGIILIFVIKAFDLPNYIVTTIILAAVLGWVFFANRIRTEYKSVFMQSLRVRSSKLISDEQSIIERYLAIFEQGNDAQIIKALRFFKNRSVSNLVPVIPSLLSRNNANIVIETLEMIMYKPENFSDEVLPLLRHENPNVKISAFEYLINHQEKLKPEFLINLLNKGRQDERLTAMVAFAKEFQNDPRTLNVLRIKDRLKNVIDKTDLNDPGQTHVLIAVLKAIGYGKISDFYDLIEAHMGNTNQRIRNHAFMAAGHTQSTRFFRALIEVMPVETNELFHKALSRFGSQRLKRVTDRLISENDIEKLRHIPSVMENIPDQNAITILQKLSRYDDMLVRNNAIMSLCQLRDRYPLLVINEEMINDLLLEEARYNNTLLNVLINRIGNEEKVDIYKEELMELLKSKIDANLTIIFNLLHIKYPPEEYLEIYDYVNSPDQTLRNNALEYLDNILGHDLKKKIIPLIEFHARKDNPEMVERKTMEMDEVEAFLCHNRDYEIRSAARKYFATNHSTMD